MKIPVKNMFRIRIEASGVKKKFICDELGITPQWFSKLLKAEEIDVNTIVMVGEIINHDFSKDFNEIESGKIYTLNQCNKELIKVMEAHVALLKEHKSLLKKYKALV